MKTPVTNNELERRADDNNLIQERRKFALKAIINVHCDGSVKKFSEITGKHPTYVYGMLRACNEKNQIKITTKMARNIEQIFGLSKFEMDFPNTTEKSLVQYDEVKKLMGFKHPYTSAENITFQNIPYMYTAPQCFMDDPHNGLDVNEELYINFRAQRGLISDGVFHTKITDDTMSPRLKKGGYAIFQYFDPDALGVNEDNSYMLNILEDNGIFLIKYHNTATIYRVIRKIYSKEIELRFDNKLLEKEVNHHVFSEDEFLESGFVVVGKIIGYFEIDENFT